MLAEFGSLAQTSVALSVELAALIVAKVALICVCASAVRFGSVQVAVLPETEQLAPEPDTAFKVNAGATPPLSVKFKVPQLEFAGPALRTV